MHDRTPAQPRPALPALALLFVVAGLLQWPLWTNLGFFSHDELQWGAFADAPTLAQLPWVAWTDVATFQYRPLTFNAWLLASHWLFEHPLRLHALWVAMGSGVAVLLMALLRRLGAGTATAGLAALAFALNPYAAYVHGWIATLADLLWVGFGLALGLALLAAERRDQPRLALGSAVVLTTLALCAKEAALVLPGLVALAWWMRGRTPAWSAGLVGTALPVLAYLMLRLDVMLAGAPTTAAYDASLAALPARWLEYPLYLPMVSRLEPFEGLAQSPGRLLQAAVPWLGVLAALAASAVRRPALAWLLLGGTVALGPVLLLPSAATQYGYGWSVLVAAVLGLAWPRLAGWGRAVVLLLAVLSTWHGSKVMRDIAWVGGQQANFHASLLEVLAVREGPVRVRLPADRGWVYQRLTHEVPRFRGVTLEGRLVMVADDGPVDFEVGPEGRLQPVP